MVIKLYYDDWQGLFESTTGYGLGGSSMALFGRVGGGGIYTKAADVGADLVGKVEQNIPEDMAMETLFNVDNLFLQSVAGNVGDISGMGTDLFGSYAESSCVALVVASISSFGINHDLTAILYPLLISYQCHFWPCSRIQITYRSNLCHRNYSSIFVSFSFAVDVEYDCDWLGWGYC